MITEKQEPSSARRVARNYAFLSGAQVVTMGLGLVTIVSIARHYGASEYGKLAFATAFASYFALVHESVVTLGVRELSRRRSETLAFAGSLALFRLSVALASFLAMAFTAVLIVSDAESLLLVVALGICFLTAAADLGWAFNAQEAMAYPSLSKSAGQLVYTALVLCVVIIGAPLPDVAAALLVGNATTVLLSFAFFRRQLGRPTFAIRLREYRAFVSGALPIALSYALVQGYAATGIVLLSYFGSSEAVGWYSAGNRIVMGGIVPFSFLFFNAIYPLLSRQFLASAADAGRLIEQSIKLMVIVALPVAVGGSILAPEIVRTLYGPGYAPATSPFQILVWAAAGMFLNQALSSPLLSLDRPGIFARNVGVGLLVNLATNLALIPRLGATGVATATLITEIAVLTLGGIEIRRAVPYSFWRLIPRPAAAAALMGVVIWPIASRTIFATIPLGLLVYAVSLVLIGGVTAEERAILRSFVHVNLGKETTK